MDHVQTKTAYNASATSHTLTFDASTTSGSLCTLVVTSFQAGGADLSVTDNKGNTWTRRVHTATIAGNTTRVDIFDSINITGGAFHQVTITPASGSAYVSAGLSEWSVTDDVEFDDSASATPTSTTTPSTGNVTTTEDDALLVAVFTTVSNYGTGTPGTSFTERYDVGNNANMPIYYESRGEGGGLAAGDYAADFASSGAAIDWACALAAYKPASGGGGTPMASWYFLMQRENGSGCGF